MSADEQPERRYLVTCELGTLRLEVDAADAETAIAQAVDEWIGDPVLLVCAAPLKAVELPTELEQRLGAALSKQPTRQEAHA